MQQRAHLVVLILAIAAVLSGAAEFQVNTTVANDQERVAVAQLSNGDVVFAWEDESAGVSEIWIRRYDSNLVALAAPARAHAISTNDQSEPAIAALAGGRFVLVWSARNSDASDYGVVFRRFESTGVAVDASPVAVNTTTSGAQFHPHVAVLTGGGFIVVFTDQSGAYAAGAEQDVRYRAFNANGTPGNPTDLVANGWGVDARVAGNQARPRVAALPGNGFVIVYEDRAADDVYAVRFDGSGNPLQVPGAASGFRQMLVNSPSAFEQTAPDVAPLTNGGFVAVYNSETNGTAAGRRVVARLFNAAGIGAAEIVTGSFNTRAQDATVAVLANGEFVIAAQTLGIGADAGTNNWSILGQRFSSAGTPLTPSFLVNTFHTGDQDRPAIAALRNGYITGWQSFAQDSSFYGVFAQRYTANGDPAGRLFIARQNPSGSSLLLTHVGAPYVNYRLQTSATLSAWSTLQSTSAASGTFQYVHTNNNPASRRFYRVITP